MDEPDDVRHGVFLLPDARTSAAVSRITASVRAQFGVVSAGRFPPHVTLAGSLPLAVGEAELVSDVRRVAARRGPVEVVNAGPKRLWGAVIAFDVHEDGQGRPSSALLDLAADIGDAVRPLLRPVEALPADVRDRDEWHGHLSLASHELLGRPDLLEEIDEFVRQLDEPYPPRFEASRLGIFRLHHRDWRNDWWTDFSWERVGSVRLDGSAERAPRSPRGG